MFEKGPPLKRELQAYIVATEDFLDTMKGFLRNSSPGQVEMPRRDFDNVLDGMRVGRALAIELIQQREEHPLCERDAYDPRLTPEQQQDVQRYLLGDMREVVRSRENITPAQREWLDRQLELLDL